MKSLRIAVCALLILAATVAVADSEGKKSFDALKALQGLWSGQTSGGQAVSVSFRMTAGGTTLMSEIQGMDDMISM